MLKLRVLRSSISLLAVSSVFFAASHSFAQEASEAPASSAESANDDGNEIVVIAGRIAGSVETDAPPVLELSEGDVASYGVSSITDLLAALAPQTGSGRGRGSGQPIVLLNGQRVSGFRELRNIPPEAIRKVEVFPEEVALQYGYRPDQRVINFILKDDFSSITGELEGGIATAGGYDQREVELGYTKFSGKSRLNLNLEYEGNSSLLESERDIIQTDETNGAVTVATDPMNEGRFRTLTPKNDSFDANLNYSTPLSDRTSLSLNAGYQYQRNMALFGLNGVTLVTPATNPESPFATDTEVRRTFIEPRPLTRISETNNYVGGLTLNTGFSDWNVTATASYDRARTDTATDQRADFTGLLLGAGSSDPALAINPLDPDLGALLGGLEIDRATSTTQTIDSLVTISGNPIVVPAGAVSTTLSGGFTRRTIDSFDTRAGAGVSTNLSRNQGNFKANVNLPIASRRDDVWAAIGDLSVNGNIGYSTLSDFGGLWEYGGGINWSPVEGLSLQASYIGEEAAPSVGDLGGAVIQTPNVSVFDLTNSETVLATIISGGNPNLVGERRRDFKLGINYEPDFLEGLGIISEYFRNRSFDTSNSFPLLTPEIEAAFPDRVVRGADGTLLSIDQRPVTYDRVASERIRTGFNFSKSFGQPTEGGRGGMGGGRGPGAGGPPGGGRGFGGPGGPGSGGRWNIALYHTYRLEEQITIRPGVPTLDLLNGSAIGSNGGAARNEFTLEGGWFNKGLGIRVSGNYDSGSTVNGTGLAGSTDLDFGSLATLNLRMFVDLGQQEKLAESVPFLKGARVSLRIDNLFDTARDVRDDSGLVPLRYQPGFVDPLGRTVVLSFRKIF